jgi:hypothetical protein
LEILLKMFRQEMANIGGHSPGSSQAAIFLINPMATSVVQQQCPPIQVREKLPDFPHFCEVPIAQNKPRILSLLAFVASFANPLSLFPFEGALR